MSIVHVLGTKRNRGVGLKENNVIMGGFAARWHCKEIEEKV
jgi:hypothetical protein